MSISRMMAEQVKQSEDAIGLLGKEYKTKLSRFSRFGLNSKAEQVGLAANPSYSPLISYLIQNGTGNQR